MKNKFTLIYIFIFLLPIISNGQIIDKTDEFTGHRTVSFKDALPIIFEKDSTLEAKFAAFYMSYDSSDYYQIVIKSPKPMIESFGKAYFLIDEKRFIKKVKVSNNKINLATIEVVKSFFDKISSANSARVKIGKQEFTITNNVKEAMVKILDKLN